MFWISFRDFVSNFSYIYGCKFFDKSWAKDIWKGSWCKGKDGGCSNYKQLYKNPCYIINILKDTTQLFIMLVQEKKRLADGNLGK